MTTQNIPQPTQDDDKPYTLVWHPHRRFENWYNATYNADELQITYNPDGYRFIIVSLDCPDPHETVMRSQDLCSDGGIYPTLLKAVEACHRCYFKGDWRNPS